MVRQSSILDLYDLHRRLLHCYGCRRVQVALLLEPHHNPHPLATLPLAADRPQPLHRSRGCDADRTDANTPSIRRHIYLATMDYEGRDRTTPTLRLHTLRRLVYLHLGAPLLRLRDVAQPRLGELRRRSMVGCDGSLYHRANDSPRHDDSKGSRRCTAYDGDDDASYRNKLPTLDPPTQVDCGNHPPICRGHDRSHLDPRSMGRGHS